MTNPSLPTSALSPFVFHKRALQNASKYSGEKRVEVRLSEESNQVHLIVQDSGKDFDVEAAMEGGGLGLLSIQERVSVNGSINIQSTPTIEVLIPLDAQPFCYDIK